MSEIVVTGCSGFLGTELCNKLLSEGFIVTGIDVVKPSFKHKDFKFKDIDVSNFLNRKQLNRVCKDKVVIHCAASVPITRVGATGHFKTNALGTYFVALAKPKKIIFISTSAVYGIPKDIITEDTKFDPIEDYGDSKIIAENFLKLTQGWRESTIILRPRTIIGRGRMGMMDFLFPRIMKNKSVFLIGDGSNKFQLLSLEDLINAILFSIEKDVKFADYNLGTDKFTTLGNDIEELIHIVGSKSKIIHLPKVTRYLLGFLDRFNLSPMTKWHYDTIFHDFVFDTTKAQKELDWVAWDSNIGMLVKTYTWYEIHKDDIGNTPHTKKISKKLLEWI
jgi:nucleoside-diphosphate-sugar epimerase